MAVPQTVAKVLKQIERQAGYVGFFSFVGPEPQRGGPTCGVELLEAEGLDRIEARGLACRVEAEDDTDGASDSIR